ncbi:hypothetical protein HaLaN_13042, partial [Haematococcus lacustris]
MAILRSPLQAAARAVKNVMPTPSTISSASTATATVGAGGEVVQAQGSALEAHRPYLGLKYLLHQGPSLGRGLWARAGGRAQGGLWVRQDTAWG